jgi:radical SAM superfamily enzyme YgiQ (UPF0313 family)
VLVKKRNVYKAIPASELLRVVRTKEANVNKMVKVLLVNPPYNITRYMGKLGEVGWVIPPIGLLYIASYVKSKMPELSLELYDSQVDHRNFRKVLTEFKPDVVGITCQTALVYSVLETAEIVKNILPDCKVIVGGVHATVRPLDLLKKNVNLVVRGEGEETFHEILMDKAYNDIKGVTFSDGDKIIDTPERPINPNLDEYPVMDWSLVDLTKYHTSPDMKMGDKCGFILTTRGCPYNCQFCANKLLTKRRYRKRGIPHVLAEIDYLVNKYHINQLIIYDDNFSVDKKRTIELCKAFIDRGYHKKFTWWAESRVDCLDDEVLGWMKKSGCQILSFGLESGNQRLLDFIGKRITIEQVRKTVASVKKAGIYSRGSFILGLPTSTREEDEITIKFAYSLPLDQVRFAIATPLPGTDLWDIAVKEGKIDPDTIDWTHLSLMGGYTNYDPPYYPDGRSAKELKQLQKKANLGFYLRPRIILGYIGRMKSPKQVYHIVKGGIRLIRSSGDD